VAIANRIVKDSLTPAQVRKLVARKHKERAILIARTETMRSANAGVKELWLQARDDGFIDANQLRVWIVTPDDRLRQRHAEMDGQVTGIDQDFQPIAEPGLEPNCRCSHGLATEEDIEAAKIKEEDQRRREQEGIEKARREAFNSDDDGWWEPEGGWDPLGEARLPNQNRVIASLRNATGPFVTGTNQSKDIAVTAAFAADGTFLGAYSGGDRFGREFPPTMPPKLRATLAKNPGGHLITNAGGSTGGAFLFSDDAWAQSAQLKLGSYDVVGVLADADGNKANYQARLHDFTGADFDGSSMNRRFKELTKRGGASHEAVRLSILNDHLGEMSGGRKDRCSSTTTQRRWWLLSLTLRSPAR